MTKKQIPGHPDYYATKDGRIWSEPRRGAKGRWLKPCLARGYLKVSLMRDGKRHLLSIHRLVLQTYVGPRPDGMECRHLDGNRVNNRLDNLNWGTRNENQQDRLKHGTSNHGERCGNAKLTDSIVVLIRQLWDIRWTGITQYELAEMFGVSQSNINSIVNKKSWKHK